MTVAEAKILQRIDLIADKDVRAMMKVCQGSKKHPLDCITDGGLELLVAYILKLESVEGKTKSR